ncbi:flp operon protein C [Pasteurella canis]|uniref:flp operon protein C n=1 Tax=Pasteurella canis TaxID=753 RepID=UPI001CC1158D|nr:flp operon protein C [Pasteurella canis]UAX43007.1 flp operon protein C [Pasteurella canis]
MNYRTLFIISFLTLAVGIGGILFLPTDNDGASNTNNPSSQVDAKPQKLITLAELQKNVAKGSLLQADDYVFTEITVNEDNPLVSNDIRNIINNTDSKSLQGYLVSENIKSGSLLSPELLIAPNDPRFLLSNLDTTQEVAYRVYLSTNERYLLDSIRVGDLVSVYNQKLAAGEDNNQHRTELVKIADKFLVLQVQEFKEDDQNSANSSEYRSKEYVGYINLKANVKQVKGFYSLDKDSKLVILPADGQQSNHRGIFIRKLRGQ